jgi:hypothetical protein
MNTEPGDYYFAAQNNFPVLPGVYKLPWGEGRVTVDGKDGTIEMRTSATMQVYRHKHVNLGNVTKIFPHGMINTVSSEGHTSDFMVTLIKPCGFRTDCCIETNMME